MGHTEFIELNDLHLLDNKYYWEMFWDSINSKRGADWDIDN